MPLSTTYTVANIIAITKGETPWYDKVTDGWRHLKNAQDDISNLSAGSAPGWNSAIDTRWSIADTSSSTTTYTGLTTPAATGSDDLQAGYRILFDVANNNTGAATLNVASNDGAVDIKKISSGAKVALDANDMDSDTYCDLIFDGSHWVMLNPPTAYTSPLTAKGDTFSRTSSADTRLAVGANTQVLTADSTEATGIKWATPFSSPLTTKGDVLGFSTTNARLGAGTNGYTLTAQSGQTTGLLWAQLGTGGIADGAITAAKIADGTIVAAEVASDAITTVKVVDNAITLAKLEDGTVGDVLYYGASGAPSRLNKPGTPAGEVLTFKASATAPTWTRTGRVVDVTHKIETASAYMRSTSYIDSAWDVTHVKLSATSTLFISLNLFVNTAFNFENVSSCIVNMKLANTSGTLIVGTTTDILISNTEDVGEGTGVAWDNSYGVSRMWKVLTANCPGGTTGSSTFDIWAKINNAADGGVTFENGTFMVWEIEE